MMRFDLRHDLPLVDVALTFRGASQVILDVLVDTGSASTVISADAVATIGLVPEPGDVLRTLRGVAGREVVFTRVIDRLRVGEHSVDGLLIEIGAMDYGFAIGGIFGMDFLMRAGAVLDLGQRTLTFR